MIASFSIRAFGTVFPQIFKNILIVKATILINVLFILSNLLFWLVLYWEYISTAKVTLKKACMLAIIGSLAVSVIYMKKLPFVFDMNIHFPPFIMNPFFDAVVPLMSSAFHLIFFITFKKSLELDEKIRLSKAILSIIIGISIYTCLHLIVLFNFLETDRFEWLEHMPRIVAVSTVPLIIVAVFLILSFYYRFYKFLDSRYKIENESA
jgi:hypothetical protein